MRLIKNKRMIVLQLVLFGVLALSAVFTSNSSSVSAQQNSYLCWDGTIVAQTSDCAATGSIAVPHLSINQTYNDIIASCKGLSTVPERKSCVGARAPTCYNHNGSQMVLCSTTGAGANLQPGTCYTETRSGPNGQLSGYQPTSCDDGTDRDQDGIPGGDGSAAEDLSFETDCNGENLNTSNCGIISYVVLLIRVLSFAVGIVVAIMIVWGGVQYSSARDNPQQAASAKDHIRNAVFALVFYIFSIAFLNYIVPGGVF